jgi:Putative peptidoglycan binding domain/Caspase domain
MPRMSIAAALIVVCAGLLATAGARAQSIRAALVIGNATYTSLPAISACARSGHAVSAALTALGFAVTEREDASSGAIDAGIAEFSQHLAAGRGAAVVYVCGYGTSFNNRPFLLPTTASISRPSDVLTQGVLAKSLLDTVNRDNVSAAVVAFDLVAKPDGPPQLGLESLAGVTVTDGVGIIGVAEPAVPAEGPTPLASALIAGLAGPTVRSEALLAAVQTQLTAAKLNPAALHMPVQSSYLAGAPPPPAPAAAALAPPPAAPASPPAPVPPPVAVATPPAAAPPAVPSVALPDDSQMTEADRRAVQAALGRLGYYDLPVDGVFGPETRAAIRRYQHEVGAEMTGRLTAAQASRLVSTR